MTEWIRVRITFTGKRVSLLSKKGKHHDYMHKAQSECLMTYEHRDRVVTFRLTEAESAAIHEAAEEAGLSLSQWLRLVAVTAAGDDVLVLQLLRLDI